MEPDAALSSVVREQINRKEWSIRTLAGRATMDPGLLSRKMRGERPWRHADLYPVAKALGTTADVLVQQAAKRAA